MQLKDKRTISIIISGITRSLFYFSPTILVAIISHKYGSENIGNVAFINAFLTILFIFSDLGLGDYLLTKKKKEASIVQFIFSSILLSSLSVLLSLILGYVFPEKFGLLIDGGILIFIFLSFANVTGLFLLYYEKYLAFSVINIIGTLLLVLFPLLINLSPFYSYVFARYFAWLLISLVSVIILMKVINNEKEFKLLSLMDLKKSSSISLFNFLVILFFQLDVFLLGFFSSESTVGAYASIVIISTLPRGIFGILQTVIFRMIALEKIKDIKRKIFVFSGILFVLGVIFASILLLGNNLIADLFNIPEIINIPFIIAGSTIASSLFIASLPFSFVLISTKKTMYAVVTEIISLGFYLLVFFFLNFSIKNPVTSIVIAFPISMAFFFVFNYVFFKKNEKDISKDIV